ncbi:MAG: ubiA, partial [Thermoleophilia bacterium]|nr:ubiA [Thermoleophilia bacterium]
VDFDRAQGLHSVPARFGIARALAAVRVAHVVAVAAIGVAGALFGLGPLFWVALAIAAGLLAWENALVSADDLSRIDKAFFTVNSWVGVVLGIGLMLGTL